MATVVRIEGSLDFLRVRIIASRCIRSTRPARRPLHCLPWRRMGTTDALWIKDAHSSTAGAAALLLALIFPITAIAAGTPLPPAEPDLAAVESPSTPGVPIARQPSSRTSSSCSRFQTLPRTLPTWTATRTTSSECWKHEGHHADAPRRWCAVRVRRAQRPRRDRDAPHLRTLRRPAGAAGELGVSAVSRPRCSTDRWKPAANRSTSATSTAASIRSGACTRARPATTRCRSSPSCIRWMPSPPTTSPCP